jgi:hypothetical protein
VRDQGNSINGPEGLENRVRIGVDDLFQAKGRWWCHLICDDFSQGGLRALHQFAQRLGLPPRAFHNPPGHPRPHYDLRPEYRERALSEGAEPLTRRQLVEFLQRGRDKIEEFPSS